MSFDPINMKNLNRYILTILLLSLAFDSLAQTPPRRPRKSVAILIFEGVQIIDYTGPYEVFGQAGYNVFTVGESPSMINTSMNMKVTPSFDLTTAPEADIIVLPGGNVPHDMPATHPMVQWIKAREGRASYILSVCNGAFMLGATGFLDNRNATTTAGMINHLQMYIPKVKPVYDQRFVQDGKFISAGGLSAGIDASIYIVSLLDTKGRAQEVANQMEYNYDPNGTYVRTKLVDYQLARLLDFNPPLRGKTLLYEGDQKSWTASYQLTRNQTLAEFNGQLYEMARSTGWNMLSENKVADKMRSEWGMTDHNNLQWKLTSEFTKLEGDGQFTAYFRLEKN